MDKKKYVISYFEERSNGVFNYQQLFDSYDEAVEFGRKLCICSNIKSVCLETLIVSYSETSVLKD